MPSPIGAERIRIWREHPAQMVRDLFAIGRPDSPPGYTLDGWQLQVLEDFPRNPRQAMVACKGPGKTAVLAWLCWNYLLTRPGCKIGALSITADNLRDNLWSEMSKWQKKSKLLSELFTWQAERISCNENPNNWWMSFRIWSKKADEETLGETLAGMWADYAMIVMDEASGIPVAILRTAEAICAQAGSDGREAHVLLAGNTTSTSGALYEAGVSRRHMWAVYEITADPDDPNRTSRIPKEYAAQQIKEYGRDDTYVMINILGKFPKQGINTFISADDVIAAQKRDIMEGQIAAFPRIIGADIARYGDDEIVFFKRQGKMSWPPLRMRGLSVMQGAPHLARIATEWGAQSVQIDGATFGAAWYDWMIQSGFTSTRKVDFGGKPKDPRKFKNMRAEIYWEMCEWIKEGGKLPPIPEMVKGLTTMTYAYTLNGLIQVEDKDQIKRRLGRSPDPEDALACTFAHPVAPKSEHLPGTSGVTLPGQTQHCHEYDPWAREFGNG